MASVDTHEIARPLDTTEGELGEMAKTFKEAWDKHPAVLGDKHPCRKPDGTEAFANQCAIRLSIALKDAGFDIEGFKIVKCWYHHDEQHYERRLFRPHRDRVF